MLFVFIMVVAEFQLLELTSTCMALNMSVTYLVDYDMILITTVAACGGIWHTSDAYCRLSNISAWKSADFPDFDSLDILTNYAMNRLIYGPRYMYLITN